MARSTPIERLGAYERLYRELTEEITQIGFISSGSVIARYTHCGNPGCRCNKTPPELHGPYWQWSSKVKGVTVTKRLNDAEAKLYKEWITNDRRLHALITKMRKVSKQALDVMLKEVAND